MFLKNIDNLRYLLIAHLKTHTNKAVVACTYLIKYVVIIMYKLVKETSSHWKSSLIQLYTKTKYNLRIVTGHIRYNDAPQDK